VLCFSRNSSVPPGLLFVHRSVLHHHYEHYITIFSETKRTLKHILQILNMSSSGHLDPSPPPQYANGLMNDSATYGAERRMNPPYADVVNGTAPRYIPHGFPVQNNFLYGNRPHGVDVQGYPTYAGVIPQQYSLPQNGSQFLYATNADPLDQIVHFMASNKACRYFMLGICTEQYCGCTHDATFRDTLMGTLFGDAWEELHRYVQQNTPTRNLSKDHADISVKKDQEANPVSAPVIGEECEVRASLPKLPSTLNPAAGIYMPSSMSVTHDQTESSVLMEEEKLEIQACADSENIPAQDSVIEPTSPARQHGRHRQKLHAVRDRVSVWGKAAWRKTAKTRRKTNSQSDSKAALEQEGP